MTIATATTPPTSTWQIDPAHTGVEFGVKHMMFSTVRGRFKDVKGTIERDEQNPANSTVTVEIAATSIDTGVADRDGHLRGADFFDVETYPTLTFRSKHISGAMLKEGDRFQVTGDLTIRDKTAEVTLEGELEGTGKDPWGNTRAGVRITGKVDRREWGLQWNQALETGGILVGNDVKIEIQLQAVRQG